jgi:hypothetical protein
LQPSLARLVRHPDSRDAVRGITVRLERSPGVLSLRYELDADLGRLRIPEAGPFRAGEKLWQHTCFEIFVSSRMPAYREFNFSPSGEWAAYSFRGYREGGPAASGVNSLSASKTTNCLSVAASIACDPRDLKVALSAVVEDAEGALSYWALRHPPGKPDFHHSDGFVLELHEIRH